MKKLFLYIFLVLLMISACSEQNVELMRKLEKKKIEFS